MDAITRITMRTTKNLDLRQRIKLIATATNEIYPA
ncbi:hypothetical protein T06_7465 [Trichinella sp. T6]|nr:hypothetical protein T06_7465 [Trichinella sp. T6]